jgi:hypothetical protein
MLFQSFGYICMDDDVPDTEGAWNTVDQNRTYSVFFPGTSTRAMTKLSKRTRSFKSQAEAPYSYQGTVPFSSEKVPVGPSGPRSARRTGSRAPSSTLRPARIRQTRPLLPLHTH